MVFIIQQYKLKILMIKKKIKTIVIKIYINEFEIFLI